MPALPELQIALGGALRTNDAAGLWSLFSEPQEVAERRFAAYRRNVIGNWRSALASTYPVLAQLLGPRHFRDLADQYITTHPSSSGDLNAYGGELASLLDASVLSKELPWLADVARLEWALLLAYGAPDAAPFDLAALAGVPVEQQAALRLQVWPGATLIVSQWPLVDIWQAHQLAPEACDAALAAIDLLPANAPRHVLAARSEGRVFAAPLHAAEAVFLQALQASQTLAEAIGAALDSDAGFNPGSALQRLIALQALTGLIRFEENKNESRKSSSSTKITKSTKKIKQIKKCRAQPLG
jgi:hypothetical protein